MERVQTLTCERGGHEWHRPAVRGRKPKVCSDPQCNNSNDQTRGFKPVWGALAEAVLHFNNSRLDEAARSLRHMAARAELLALDIEALPSGSSGRT